MNTNAAPTETEITSAIATALGSMDQFEQDCAVAAMEDEDFGAHIEGGEIVTSEDADIPAIAAFFAEFAVEFAI